MRSKAKLAVHAIFYALFQGKEVPETVIDGRPQTHRTYVHTLFLFDNLKTFGTKNAPYVMYAAT